LILKPAQSLGDGFHRHLAFMLIALIAVSPLLLLLLQGPFHRREAHQRIFQFHRLVAAVQ
jgi:hypothetical protein